jgi:ADP-ribosylglycohydrolase
VPWTEAATPGPYAGNGAAMRAGPVGLLARTPGELVEAAAAQARVTHADPRCVAGAVAVAGAAALAAGEGPLDRAAFIAALAALVRPVDTGVAGEIEELASWSGQAPPAALRTLRRRGLVAGPGPWPGIPIHVVPSVLWSLYAFLRTPEDYWEAVCTAIWAGGDTDTTAAMTGAISGARLGPDPLPAGLLRALNDRGAWGADALAALARECVGKSTV